MPLFNRQCKEHSSVPLEVWKRNFLLSCFPIKTMLVICILCFFTHFIAKEMRTYPHSPKGKNLFKVSKCMFQFKIFCRFQTVHPTGLCYFISYLDFPQNDLDSYQRFFETYQHFVSLKEIDIIRRISLASWWPFSFIELNYIPIQSALSTSPTEWSCIYSNASVASEQLNDIPWLSIL